MSRRAYVGRKFHGSDSPRHLIEGQLYLQALPLIPQSERTFESTSAAAEFFMDPSGTVTHLVLRQTEGDVIYDRKP